MRTTRVLLSLLGQAVSDVYIWFFLDEQNYIEYDYYGLILLFWVSELPFTQNASIKNSKNTTRIFLAH
jgi:hypothetical protein